MMVRGDRSNKAGMILVLALVVICSYFLLTGTGITGAVTGVSLAQADSNEKKIDQEILNELGEELEVPVIVELKEDKKTNSDDLEEKKQAIKEKQAEVLGDLSGEQTTGFLGVLSEEKDFEVDHKYSTINAFSGNVTKKGLKKLKEDPKVKKISYDYPIKILLDDSIPVMQADKVWDYSVGGTKINGTGETVCVIDTGVDYTHPGLGGCTNETFVTGTCSKVIGGYDYGNDDNDPKDVHSHGTHVAGIVASEDATYTGVAPGAKIIAMKVFTDAGAGSTSDAISAIDWCVNNATIFNISVITMSIGVTDGGGNEIPYLTYCDNDDSLASKSSYAVSQGLFVSVSAGNNKGIQGITAPGCGENVTSVGSTTKADAVSGYNTAPILRVMATGSSITSTVLSGGFGVKSGTSMAAPHVAGGAALLIQYWKAAYNTVPDPFTVRDKLISSGTPINDTRNGYIFPRVDFLKAIQPLINFTLSSPTNDTTIIDTYTLINVSIDVNLTSAVLEWDYGNATLTNYTMDEKNLTSFSYNLTGLASGNYSYKVYGNDSVNTWGESETRMIEVDQTSPNISFYSPINNGYYKEALNLNIVLDNLQLSFSNYSIANSSGSLLQTNFNSSIGAASYNWTDLVSVLNSTFGEGTYNLTVFVNDSLSNSNQASINFTVDITAPSLFGGEVNPSIIYNDNEVYFYVNVTDTNRNASAVLVSGNWTGSWTNKTMTADSGNRFNFTLDATNLSNQENIGYQFFAVDLAGNVNNTVTTSFSVQNRDLIALSISNPAAGSETEVGNSTQFNGTGTDPDNDTLTYSWDFGDSTTASVQNPTKIFNTTGTKVVVLNVSDGLGSFNLTNISIVVNDTTSPNLTSISYDSSVHIESEGNQTVTASLHDYSGIKQVNVYYNNTQQVATCTDSNTTWSCSWSWEFNEDGSYNFTLEAMDNSSLQNSENTTYDFSVVECGDGTINGNEACDSSALDGETCVSQGYVSGTLACSASCTFDTSSCSNEAADSSSSSSGGGGGSGGDSVAPTATATPTTLTPTKTSTATTTKKTTTKTTTSTPAKKKEATTTPAAKKSEPQDTYSTTVSTTKKSASFKVKEGKIAISQVIIKTKKDVKNIKVDIKKLEKKPASLPVLENAYQYLNMEVTLKPEELDETLVIFTVPPKWLEEKSFSKVYLYTYSKRQWQRLDTKLISKEDGRYQATVKHFSYFAIGGKKGITFGITNLAGKAFSSVVNFVNEKAFGSVVNFVKTWELKNPTLWIMLGIVVVLLVIYFLIRRRDDSE